MANDSVSLVVSRPAFTELVSRISSPTGLSRRLAPPALRALSNFILDRLQPRLISFEEQVCSHNSIILIPTRSSLYVVHVVLFVYTLQAVSLRQDLASMYERDGALREAASVLSQMPLESGQKYLCFSSFISKVEFLFYDIICSSF